MSFRGVLKLTELSLSEEKDRREDQSAPPWMPVHTIQFTNSKSGSRSTVIFTGAVSS
jgi:hypothetical protein